MKKNIYLLVLTMFIAGSFAQVFGQTFECRVSENDYGYLVYEMRETSGTNTPTTSTDINDITFVIRYPSGAIDMDLICTSNDYNIFDGLAAEQSSGGYDYHYWNASAVPAVNPPHDWTVNQWEEIAVFKVTGATGSSLFEVAPNNWDGRSLNWNQTVGGTATDFLPTISGSGITYSYPTLVYDLVWTGAGTPSAFQDAHSWSLAGNWESECGDAGATPTNSNNCYIPGGLTNYPENVYLALLTGQTGLVNNLRIGSGGEINFGIPATAPELLDISGELYNYGTLTIKPNAEVTANDDTYIDADTGIVIQADATGVGSFINDSTISYGASGSGKVQTYITNGAVASSFYMHLMGPTLDDENFTGTTGTTGADLSAFNVAPGNTYAYSYYGLSNSWINQSLNTYHVYTSAGIGLSTDDATAYTMNMTGEFIYGDVPTAVLTHGGNNNNYNLISNPYPSAIEFNAFYGSYGNGSVIYDKNWVWDAENGNYIAFAGSPNTPGEFIQVGQAFFVETRPGGGVVTFANLNRTHSNTPFRDVVPNMLTMKVSGGDNGFSDRLTIRFDENATSGYDEEIEAVKWNSMYANATMIRSIAEDGTELAINVLPLEGLQGDMVSVPVHFNCGYTADYTFDFEGIDSFEAGNEVWLEDKNNNDHWFYLNNNPHYTFTAAPGDDPDRFIVHFFGPTSINDNNEAKVDIFSDGQYAYIKNVTNENIKKVSVYNIAGSLVTSRIIPEGQKLSKIWVSDHMAYYVVQVITDSKVYTNKILITK